MSDAGAMCRLEGQSSARRIVTLVDAFRHRLDGGESFCTGPNRGVWRWAADAGDRMVRAAASNHPQQGSESALARAIGRDLKGKVSPVLYVAGIL